MLARADELVLWAGAVKDYALAAALQGERFPGWKVVESRSVRRFTDDAEVARRVNRAGKDPFETKLLSVAAKEKLLGNKCFSDLLSDLTERPAGKPALIPEADKRPEVDLPDVSP